MHPDIAKLIAEIEDLMQDPLGQVFVKVWKFPKGEVIWSCGIIITRRYSSKYGALPMQADEYLRYLRHEIPTCSGEPEE